MKISHVYQRPPTLFIIHGHTFTSDQPIVSIVYPPISRDMNNYKTARAMFIQYHKILENDLIECCVDPIKGADADQMRLNGVTFIDKHNVNKG